VTFPPRCSWPDLRNTIEGASMEWRIRGYDGATEILSANIPFQLLSRDYAFELLRLLVARQLTEQEIIDAALGKDDLLEIRADESEGKPLILMAGRNPLYVVGLFHKVMDQR
jgi:hypothetical protein